MNVGDFVDLGKHHDVEPRTGTFDDTHDVVAPTRANGIYPHPERPCLPVVPGERLHDLAARRVVLVERSNGVFEIDEDLDCGQRGRLRAHALAGGGDHEARAA